MTSIIIAGRPNSEEMSECILVAENISEMYPSSRFTYVLKHPKEWEVYCEDICNLFGIVRKTYPLILFSNGKQIGGQKEFFKLIKETFNCQLLVPPEKENEEIRIEIDRTVVDNLTKENSLLVEKEFICRTKGMPVIDKITEKLDSIPLEDYDQCYSKYNTIENDYEVGYIKDMQVYYKLDKKFTPVDEEYKEMDEVIENDTVRMELEFYNKKKEEDAERKRRIEIRRLRELEKAKAKERELMGIDDKANVEEEGKGDDAEENNENNNGEEATEQQQLQQKAEAEQNRLSSVESASKVPQDAKKEVTVTSVDYVAEAMKNASTPKEVKFTYYKDMQIPLDKYDPNICIDNLDQGAYDLILNPYFTFYGETMINYHKEFVPKMPKVEEEPMLTETQPINTEENKQGIDVMNEDNHPQVEVEGEPNTENQANEGAKFKDEPNQIEEKMKEEGLKVPKGEDPKRHSKDISKPGEVKIQAAPDDNHEEDEEEEQIIIPVQKIPNPPYNILPEIPSEAIESKPASIYNPITSSKSNDTYLIKDYGKLPSLRAIPYDQDLPFYCSKIPPYQLNCQIGNSMNIFDFSTDLLNEKDIISLVSAVNDTKGYACMKILPYKYSDWKSYSSNKIRIIPSKPIDLKNEDFPIKIKIDQMVQAIKRDMYKETVALYPKANLSLILNNDVFNPCFKLPAFTSIELYDSLKIKHLIKYFPNDQFNISNIKQALRKMMIQLEINNTTGYGFNLICNQQFLFLSPLVSPYAYTKNNIPLFAEPHFFMGVFTLPIIESEWPESIKGRRIDFDLAEVLFKTTN